MPNVVIVTGLSGSGKTSALNALEDMGWFAIDNLPVTLLPKVLELAGGQEPMSRVAVGVDARDHRNIDEAGAVIDRLREAGTVVDVVFLDASDDVLIQRFSTTRRRHPLDQTGDLRDALARERTILQDMRARSDLLINTSTSTVHDIKRRMREEFADDKSSRMRLRFVSFGFKHGITPEADLVFDVRFIRNPFFEEDLRQLNGMDERVADFVLDQDGAQAFLDMVTELLRFLIPRYAFSGKSYLTVAIGCTGGQHRSVCMIEELARRLRPEGWPQVVAHRENHRWPQPESNG